MEKIRNYVNELFEGAPKTRKTRELKEEIIINLEEKYDDLIKDGMKENEAYKEVITSIGDIEELLGDLEDESDKKDSPNSIYLYNEQKKKDAFAVSISVALYILSLISAIVISTLGISDDLAGISFLTVSGLTTCYLIYHFMARPKYERIEETMVEEFKEWKAQKDQNKSLRDGLHSIVWLIIVIIYFLISFCFGIWAISWIIFLIGAVISAIIDLIFGGKK